MSFRFKQQGFSILEMVVVTGIFVMVTGIVMANLPKFRNQASLDLTAQAVALAIREAQVYGTATKVAGDVYPSYGVHFALSNNTANKNFVLFSDTDEDKVFDPGTDPGDGCGLNVGECLERYALDGPFYILALCTNDGSNEECTAFNEGDISLDLVYKRPFPEPNICLYGDPSDCNYTNATIVIGSPEGAERKLVKVWNNGQISVSNPPAAQ